MYECLVGYTPFYAEDPVMTCRKILRWQQVREEALVPIYSLLWPFFSCCLRVDFPGRDQRYDDGTRRNHGLFLLCTVTRVCVIVACESIE